ncbi:MAG: recombinase family protein, partial [bacterium]
MTIQNKLKYFLYARKSSESADRQVQSNEDQTRIMIKLAQENKIDIVDKFEESKSAKKPNNRPIFEKMLKRIEAGEANGILCWEINRLSRNPVDSGKIQWLLQQGIVQSIRTINREYKPSDNALILSVESGTANQYIIDLKKGVKRGLESKLQRGMAPMLAPLGYLNTKTENRGDNYIVKDPARFRLVRKIWDLMLIGTHTPPKILDIANNQWGLRTRRTKRKGDKPISRSTIYRILTDPFYAGLFKYDGVIYQGKHEPMITLAEFDKVQILLGRDGKPRAKTHEFPFTGMMRCAECGSAVTAINKTKVIKKTGEVKTFTYYYCTKRRKHNCSQGRYRSAEQLEREIQAEINKYELEKDYRDIAVEIIQENHSEEIQKNFAVYENINKVIKESKEQIDNLVDMRCKTMIDDPTFITAKNKLQSTIAEFEQRRIEAGKQAINWLDMTEKAINFASRASE